MIDQANRTLEQFYLTCYVGIIRLAFLVLLPALVGLSAATVAHALLPDTHVETTGFAAAIFALLLCLQRSGAIDGFRTLMRFTVACSVGMAVVVVVSIASFGVAMNAGCTVYGATLAMKCAWAFMFGVVLKVPTDHAGYFPFIQVLRGTGLIRIEEAEEAAFEAAEEGDILVDLGRIRFPLKHLLKGTLLIGAPGSGKTLSFRMAMASLIPLIGKRDLRAIVFDLKGNMPSILRAIPNVEAHRVISLDPYSTEGFAWDIAIDLQDARCCEEFGYILIPERHDHAPYFPDSARLLFVTVCEILAWLGIRFDLRDLLEIFSSKQYLEAVLSLSPAGRRLLEEYQKPANTFSNIFTTAQTRLGPLKSVAACWHNTPPDQRISLKEWYATGGRTLVFRTDTSRGGTGVTLVNQVLFARIAQLIADDERCDEVPRTLLFLDEANACGKLPILNVITTGREKGVVLMLGIQSVPAFETSMENPDLAQAILDTPDTVVILRCPDRLSAEHGSKRIGDTEVIETDFNTTNTATSAGINSSTSRAVGESQHRRLYEPVIPSEIQNLPPASRANGFHGIVTSGLIGGVYRAHFDPEYLSHRLFEPEHYRVPRRPPQDMELQPWNQDDLNRLGLRLKDTNDNSSADDTNPPPIDEVERLDDPWDDE